MGEATELTPAARDVLARQTRQAALDGAHAEITRLETANDFLSIAIEYGRGRDLYRSALTSAAAWILTEIEDLDRRSPPPTGEAGA